MLIRFAVENFMSYKDKQVFSMVAGKHKKHNEHIFEAKGKRLLKGSFFFGANAAGKSNLFKAIRFAQKIALFGIKNTSLVNRHFRIDENYKKKPGVFQFDFYQNGHFYSYGFAISYQNAIVEEEWLYLCDSSETTIFERYLNDGKTIITTDLKFENEEQKQNFKTFSDNVPDDKMLLLEIAERKLIDADDFYAFKDTITWFRNLLVILPDSHYRDKIRLLSDESDFDLSELLSRFDTGIESISLSEKSIDKILDFLPDLIKTDVIEDIETSFNQKTNDGLPKEIEVDIQGRLFKFKKENNEILAYQLMMNHGNEKDPFSLSDESDGTQRLFDLVPVYQFGRTAKVILVDELDRSFHTKLVQNFIEGFYVTTKNINSQLIASVHDSNIMNLDFLRQDEIWFVERQKEHNTIIYSLNKFQERFDKKVAKDYLLGRYGAIPCLQQLTNNMEGK